MLRSKIGNNKVKSTGIKEDVGLEEGRPSSLKEGGLVP